MPGTVNVNSFGSSIRKCSSPRGDGNISRSQIVLYVAKLGNVAPREGTETRIEFFYLCLILQLGNVAPREGTETILVYRNDNRLFH